MSDIRITTDEISARLTRMEAVQMEHLRRCMFLLLYFTVAFACLAWERLKHFNPSLEVLPFATVGVICVWEYCVARHARKLAIIRKVLLLAADCEASETSSEPSSPAGQRVAHGQEPATGV
jgi:hypothetical protein